MAVVFSTNPAVTNSTGNVARTNEQYSSFMAVVCVGFSIGKSADRFLLANTPSILPRMRRTPRKWQEENSITTGAR